MGQLLSACGVTNVTWLHAAVTGVGDLTSQLLLAFEKALVELRSHELPTRQFWHTRSRTMPWMEPFTVSRYFERTLAAFDGRTIRVRSQRQTAEDWVGKGALAAVIKHNATLEGYSIAYGAGTTDEGGLARKCEPAFSSLSLMPPGCNF